MLRNLRYFLLLLGLSYGAYSVDRRGRVADEGSDDGAVILVVSDGLRWQEVMRGADPRLLADSRDEVRRWYGRPSLAERRQALLPFVWGTMARHGLVIGNRDAGSRMRVTNGKNFSYPGYNEMLVGYPDARIDRNDLGPNPNVTVFEWINGRRTLRGHVAAVGAWDTFADIFNRDRSGLPVFAGRVEPLDARAHVAAMRVLREKRPRALFVAYVETDDLAHKGRYGDMLDAAHRVDSYLAELWSAVQSDARYRDRTTLIFTADHGRGRSGDWTDHGPDVPGADEIWVAMIGPGLPARGELKGGATYTQTQLAATVAAALGLDYRRAVPRAGPPIVR